MPGLIARAPAAVSLSSEPYATRYLRFGPSIANSADEVDRAIETVRALAGR